MWRSIFNYLSIVSIDLRVFKSAVLWVLGIFCLPKWIGLNFSTDPIKLNLGAGARRGKNGWLTVDRRGADLCWDLSKGIPLPNDSVSELYHSHLLEHIEPSAINTFLVECRRVLRVGGKMNVCVPDIEYYLKLYQSGNNNYTADPVVHTPSFFSTGSSVDIVNYIAYMNGQHRFMFDEECLVNIVRQAGFSNVRIRSFEHLLDPDSRKEASLFLEAIK
jgi:predicted SAM-dependent methyltransferase